MNLEKSFDEMMELIQKTKEMHSKTIEKIGREIVNCYRNGGKLIIFGNGGSFADALHFAAEFEGPFKNRSRPPLPALVPSNFSALTAIGNDFGYEQTFKKFVEANTKKGDIVIGISTSGNSPNVILALEEAKKKEVITIAFTGYSGGKMKNADILLNIPSTDTARIQELHHFAYHEICNLVEREMFE